MTNRVRLLFIIAVPFVAAVVVAYLATTNHGWLFAPLKKTAPEINHQSYFMDRAFFDSCYGRAPAEVSPQGGVIAGIVPHHLLACGLIAQWFDGVANKQQPSVVVIIGPNHQNIGQGAVLVSDAVWYTPYGDLNPDSAIVTSLVRSGMALKDERVFVTEHSISGIVPFVRKSFPRSNVVPIILKDRLDQKSSQALGKFLDRILPDDALVLASTDFSHYVSSSVADQNVHTIIPILLKKYVGSISDIHVDSKPTLSVLFEFNTFRSISAKLVTNSNAAKIMGQMDIPEVTSYITVYYSHR